MDGKTVFGRRLRAARIASGFQCEVAFAAVAGIKAGHLRKVERGEKCLAPEDVATVARLTGRSICFLVAGEDCAGRCPQVSSPQE
ncbi:MAG: helix-turn-helix domain-containing protein [Gammaproteobacteria bacterium]